MAILVGAFVGAVGAVGVSQGFPATHDHLELVERQPGVTDQQARPSRGTRSALRGLANTFANSRNCGEPNPPACAAVAASGIACNNRAVCTNAWPHHAEELQVALTQPDTDA